MDANQGMPGRGRGSLGNERGIALIIVLVMLLLLSILSATMLVSSTTDLQIAGNYRNNEQALFDADAAVNFGQTFDAIYTTLNSTTTSWPLPGQGQVLSSTDFSGTGANTANPDFNRITIPGTRDTADVKVELISSGSVPAGSGTQVDSGISPGSGNFKANFFAVNVIANGPNNSHAELESQIARIVQQ
jgi:hypothetical protein